jgi:hypothetical protein
MGIARNLISGYNPNAINADADFHGARYAGLFASFFFATSSAAVAVIINDMTNVTLSNISYITTTFVAGILEQAGIICDNFIS